jgi:hypothetical protein
MSVDWMDVGIVHCWMVHRVDDVMVRSELLERTMVA